MRADTATRLGSALGAALAAVLLAAAAPLLATTILLGDDGELADRADTVVVGRVLDRAAAVGRPATLHRFAVERVLKGSAPGRLLLRIPGGDALGGLHLHVLGAPELAPGDTAVLFLSRARDGAWEVLDLAAGAFHLAVAGGTVVARRDLGEVAVVGEAAAVEEEAERDFARFTRWLADRARGHQRAADYFVAATARPRTVEKFTYLGAVRRRWTEFDRGEEVVWQADLLGMPSVPGRGFGELQTAIAAWNDDPESKVAYRYGGSSFFPFGGLSGFDGINGVQFDDPQSEVRGTLTCSEPGRGSGVLATAGIWVASGRPPRIRGGDVVINDGASCWFTTSARLEQVLAHELGHTLGLGHSCADAFSGPCNTTAKDEALMRAIAHSDERGALLGDDDLAAVRSLYSIHASTGVPNPPASLAAVAVSATKVTLRWIDTADDETRFLVEMRRGGGAFRTVVRAPRDRQEATVTGLSPGGSYVFRVRASGQKGASAPSNEVPVTTPPR